MLGAGYQLQGELKSAWPWITRETSRGAPLTTPLIGIMVEMFLSKVKTITSWSRAKYVSIGRSVIGVGVGEAGIGRAGDVQATRE